MNARVLPHNAVPPGRVAAMPLRDYRARTVGDRAPVIRAGFDVHLIAHRLVYVREPCTRQDMEATFLLHLEATFPYGAGCTALTTWTSALTATV